MSTQRIRVCDWIAQRLYTLGVRHVFGVTGGGSSGLNDGIAKHGHLQWIANHHEQGSAFAAMGEAKMTGQLAVVMPTTGCGGTNCVTGVLDAWQDSTPVLFISGNVNRAQMTTYVNGALRRVRKHGAQEADIIPVVRSITKYAEVVNEPEEIVEQLEEAIWLATHGRKGPVWLDVPTDVQTALIDAPEEPPAITRGDEAEVMGFGAALAARDQVFAALATAKRPLVLLGAGAREDASDVDLFIRAYGIPFVTTFGGIDMPGLTADHPLHTGRIGIKGDRAGNFAVSTCDLLLVLGASLNTPETGYNLGHFAPHAGVIQVDIEDRANQCVDEEVVDLYIRAPIQTFVATELGGAPEMNGPAKWRAWAGKCAEWREKWPVILPEYAAQSEAAGSDGINLYTFTDALNRALPDNAAVVSDAGAAYTVMCQALKLRAGQRHITSLAQADMGWGLPAAIGVALQGVPTVVVTGDGSFQFNIQELATIRALNLPVKVIVWNNSGYLSIRATQRKMYEGRLMGTDGDHGLWFPPLQGVALVYGIPHYRIASTTLLLYLARILSDPHAALIEVICPPDQPIVPSIRAARGEDGVVRGAPLYDMAPALPPEVVAAELAAALAIT